MDIFSNIYGGGVFCAVATMGINVGCPAISSSHPLVSLTSNLVFRYRWYKHGGIAASMEYGSRLRVPIF